MRCNCRRLNLPKIWFDFWLFGARLVFFMDNYERSFELLGVVERWEISNLKFNEMVIIKWCNQSKLVSAREYFSGSSSSSALNFYENLLTWIVWKRGMRRNHNYYTVLHNRFIEATRKEVPSINRQDLQQKTLPQTPVEVGFVCSLTPHNASHRPTKKGEKNRTECFCAYRIKINYSVVFFLSLGLPLLSLSLVMSRCPWCRLKF